MLTILSPPFNSTLFTTILACTALMACGGDDPGGPSDPPLPGPGPHFSVSPIDITKLARVTPIGSNGKILPVGHTYWWTCDIDFIMPSDRPCVRERLAIRAPMSGTVFDVDHEADGEITIEGPVGLHAAFAHVTPTAGLQRGDSVWAGDTIAYMFEDYTFDLGVVNFGIPKHNFIRQERYGDGYLHAQNPIAQYPEPLRSQLLALVNTMADPLGKLVYDVAGTAQGNWFRLGTPVDLSLTPQLADSVLFLGRLLERDEVPILVSEALGYPAGYGVVSPDPAHPKWDQITEASGVVWMKLWEIWRDGLPRFDSPQGSILLQVLPNERLRLEWFDTHDPVSAFTGAARVYER